MKDQFYKIFGECVKENPQTYQSVARRGKDDLAVSFIMLVECLAQELHSWTSIWMSIGWIIRSVDLDILSWWKMNKNQYPSVSNVAKEILSILLWLLSHALVWEIESSPSTEFLLNPKMQRHWLPLVVACLDLIEGGKLFKLIYIFVYFLCMACLIISTLISLVDI